MFSITVLRDERVVVVAEQRPACTDEEAFTWMNNVVPAVESIHGLNLYGIVLVPPGRLPRVRARGRGLWVWLLNDSEPLVYITVSCIDAAPGVPFGNLVMGAKTRVKE